MFRENYVSKRCHSHGSAWMTGFGGFGHVSTEGADGVDAFGLEGDVGLGFFGRWCHGVGVLEF